MADRDPSGNGGAKDDKAKATPEFRKKTRDKIKEEAERIKKEQEEGNGN